MSAVLVIYRRELRAFFNTPIAYIFLLVFSGAALFTFFNVHAFFARGQADMRGLFEAIPLLMLLLVPALTMRLWAEESKSGTLELLFTLPVTALQAIAGKYLAGSMFLGLALLLNIPPPCSAEPPVIVRPSRIVLGPSPVLHVTTEPPSE